MRRFIVVVFSIFIAAVSCHAGELLLKKNQIIVCLGNSITEQGERGHGYVSVMRKTLQALRPDLNAIIVNSGIGGQKAPDMAARFRRDVLDYMPDWVTISVGINDVWHGFYDNHTSGDGPLGVPLNTYKQKVTEMVRAAKSSGARVVLFTTTVIKEVLSSPENLRLVSYNKAVREIAKKNGCLLADQNAAFAAALAPIQKPGMPTAGFLTSDGVHMLPAGNLLMAKTALQAFGVTDSMFNAAQQGVDTLIEKEESSDLSPLDEGEKRLLIAGSPAQRWKLRWEIDDQTFRSDVHPQETLAQIAARIKHQFAEQDPTHLLIFLDGIEGFAAKAATAQQQSAFSKIALIANRAGVSMAVVVPVGGKTMPKPLRWMLDTCQWYGVTILRNVRSEITKYITDSIGIAPVAMTPSGLFTGTVEVTIESMLETGPIQYWTDDDQPGVRHNYTGPISVDATTRITAESFWTAERNELMEPLAKPPIRQAVKQNAKKKSKSANGKTPAKHAAISGKGSRKFAVEPPPTIIYSADSSSGRRTEGWKRIEPRPAQVLLSRSPGLKFTYHEGAWETLPVFDTVAVVRQGIVRAPGLDSLGARAENFGAVFAGLIDIPETGFYTFFLRSDDGSRLLIDGRWLIDNDGIHGYDEVSGQIALAKGPHAISLQYFQRLGGLGLQLSWKLAGQPKQVIPGDRFLH